MSASTFSNIVDTVKNAAANVDADQIQRFTGQHIDTVDQFMARTSRTGPKNYGRGFLAGVIGGIVGVGVKMLVDRYVAPDVEQAEDRLAEDMVNAAESYAGLELTETQESAAEAILEVGIGALIGGVYGLAVEALPEARHDKTQAKSLLETTQKLAGPAVGMAPKLVKGLNNKHVESLAGNAAYGATLEIVRRTTRYYMEEK